MVDKVDASIQDGGKENVYKNVDKADGDDVNRESDDDYDGNDTGLVSDGIVYIGLDSLSQCRVGGWIINRVWNVK